MSVRTLPRPAQWFHEGQPEAFVTRLRADAPAPRFASLRRVVALRSVLVVRLSALGDVLFALPAVRALIESGRAQHVSWLVEDRAAGLLAGVAGLSDIVVFPRRSPSRWARHFLTLRARNDDVVVDLQGNLKSRLQLAFLRAPRKLGFNPALAREGSHRAFTEQITPPRWARHRVQQSLALVEALGIPVDHTPIRPPLTLDDAARRRVGDFLGGLAGPSTRRGPLVVLHPGTSAFGAFKRWAPGHFSAVGLALVREHGARVLVTGGPDEEALVAAVRAAAPEALHAGPRGGLPDLLALLAAADLVVASDSLPLHLANFLGTPVVGLYGPKDAAVTGPCFDRSVVVRAGVACSPCTLRRCRDRLCMDRLAPDAVTEAALALLDACRR